MGTQDLLTLMSNGLCSILSWKGQRVASNTVFLVKCLLFFLFLPHTPGFPCCSGCCAEKGFTFSPASFLTFTCVSWEEHQLIWFFPSLMLKDPLEPYF